MHHLELFDVEIKELFLSVAILNLEWIGLKPKKMMKLINYLFNADLLWY